MAWSSGDEALYLDLCWRKSFLLDEDPLACAKCLKKYDQSAMQSELVVRSELSEMVAEIRLDWTTR